ncbi:MAG: sugar phosphate isomerase/epimerase [Gemmatales bacterium]
MLTLLLASVLTCAEPPPLFAQDNLVAWCVVPFDARQRGPADRVAMLKELKLTRYAYDWRDKHLPTFEEEVQLLRPAGITLHAVWFPTTLNRDAQHILKILKKHDLHPELWVSLDEPPGATTADKVTAAVKVLQPLQQAAQTHGCLLCLYNHGGWMGEPAHQLAILQQLAPARIGLIYNLHHAHSQLNQLDAVWHQLLPHLQCVTLNGMDIDGDKHGRKILPLGVGTQDVTVLKQLQASGYKGRVAILGHMHEYDVADRLRDNLDGLRWLVPQLDGKPATERPAYRTYR